LEVRFISVHSYSIVPSGGMAAARHLRFPDSPFYAMHQ